MKKLFLFVLCTFFVSSLQAQERIMLIADPHVLPQTVIDQEEDFESYMAGQRKMIDLSEPIWRALMDTAMKYRPSLVLIPGDLTRDGEQAAHDTVAAALNRLQQAGIRTLVIPGNHDLPGDNWETLYPGTFINAAKEPNTHSFAVSPLEGVTVIGIDGSKGNAGTGQLSDATLSWVLEQADAARAQGHMIIAMTHWQILEHFDQQGTLESSCRFKNADALRDSLMKHGVHLVLTGHFHVNGVTTWLDEQTNDSLVEITTGSPITYPCPYRWLTLSEDRSEIAVSTDYITAVDTIADLFTYSRAWMAEHTQNLIPTLAKRVWGKVDSKWDSSIVPMLKKAGLGTATIAVIKGLLPSTDEKRIDLTRRHLGNAAVNLYLFHSEANENERPELGQALADPVYAGMDGMMDECFILLSKYLQPIARSMAEEPVQSMVEDLTQWSSDHPNLTDDLHPTLRLYPPYKKEETAVITLKDGVMIRKEIRNGQLILHYGEQRYNANGQRLAK